MTDLLKLRGRGDAAATLAAPWRWVWWQIMGGHPRVPAATRPAAISFYRTDA